jgi:hypothetical protein
MSNSYIEFFVMGDAASARAAVEDALLEQQFRLNWLNDWTATAERGSKGANFLLGGMVKYLELGVRIMSGQGGQTVVHIDSESAGEHTGGSAWVGDAIGSRQMDAELATLRGDLELAFTNAGVLRNIVDG